MEKKDKYHNGMAKRQLISFDWAMKSILRNKENFDILEGFLQELTGEEFKILELLESESNAEQFNQKVNRVDLLAKDKNDVRIFIELQFVKEIDYFQRMLFGTSKIITENLESGNEYSQVKRILSIHIVYFDLGHGTDYIYKGSTNFVGLHDGSLLELNNSQKEQFKLSFVSEIFPQYYVIRIGNYDNQVNNTLDEWVYFLKNDSIDDSFTAKSIKLADEKLNILKLSRAERKKYEAHKDYLRFEKSVFKTAKIDGYEEGFSEGYSEGVTEGKEQGFVQGIQQGIEQGFEKGIEQGIEKGIEKGSFASRCAIASQLLKMATFSVEEVASIVNLSVEEVENL